MKPAYSKWFEQFRSNKLLFLSLIALLCINILAILISIYAIVYESTEFNWKAPLSAFLTGSLFLFIFAYTAYIRLNWSKNRYLHSYSDNFFDHILIDLFVQFKSPFTLLFAVTILVIYWILASFIDSTGQISRLLLGIALFFVLVMIFYYRTDLDRKKKIENSKRAEFQQWLEAKQREELFAFRSSVEENWNWWERIIATFVMRNRKLYLTPSDFVEIEKAEDIDILDKPFVITKFAAKNPNYVYDYLVNLELSEEHDSLMKVENGIKVLVNIDVLKREPQYKYYLFGLRYSDIMNSDTAAR